MSKTVGNIKTRIWQEMEQNTNSTTYNTTRLLDMINEVGQEIWEGKVANELTNRFVQGNVLDFATNKFAITPVADLAIGGNITTASTTITITTTNLPTAGAIMLGNEVIEYTGKTGTEITGVTGILTSHTSGEFAVVLYKVPTDFRKPLKVYTYSNEQEIEIDRRDNLNTQYKYYEMLGQYMYFYGTETDKIYVKYVKEYVYHTADGDTSLFPDNIAINILPFICGGRMIKDEVLRVKLLTQGYNKMATEYAKQGEKTGRPKGIERKRFGFNSVR